jgi:hypothetical protein
VTAENERQLDDRREGGKRVGEEPNFSTGPQRNLVLYESFNTLWSELKCQEKH